MATMAKLLTVAALALACHPGGIDVADAGAPLILTPASGLEADVRAAALAWSDATGLDIQIGPGGAAVERAELDTCGLTSMRAGVVRSVQMHAALGVGTVAVPGGTCKSLAETLRHEIGHAITRHWNGTGGHPAAGLMSHEAQSAAGELRVDIEALEFVCAFAPCRWMMPE